ncbi:hypothetical protein HMPREF9099_02719 [Lachnospiraceae bacterium oral taxon 082 str. F0431]|jgi:hypothetical protein|nr:hypothetical protein HMPREF9099_02719 [Lachnospiraceae bacterium oral taxon 082 str. F0431]
MELDQALEIYEKNNPNYKVDIVLDVGDEWVISARDKETNLEVDVAPVAINKYTGESRVFFPPMNMEKMAKAIAVDFD